MAPKTKSSATATAQMLPHAEPATGLQRLSTALLPASLRRHLPDCPECVDGQDPAYLLAVVLRLLQKESDAQTASALRCMARELDQEVRKDVRRYARKRAEAIQQERAASPPQPTHKETPPKSQ